MSAKATYVDGTRADNYISFVFRMLFYFILLTPLKIIDTILDEIF